MFLSLISGSQKRLSSTILCIIIVVGAVGVFVPRPAHATICSPQPSYGTAVVGGDYSEWDLAEDFFANMYEGWDYNGWHRVTARLYLRYDCSQQVMYVLVLADSSWGQIATGPQGGDSWVALNSESNKVVTQSSGNNGNPPDFAWIGLSGDGNFADGWEASFSMSPGTYDIIVHTSVWYNDAPNTSGTYRKAIDLCVSCPPVSGMKFDDKDGDGVKDAGELGLSGWTINLYRYYSSSGTWSLVDSTVTVSGGVYSFSGLSDHRTYKVCEVVQPDYVQTYPKSPDGVECNGAGEGPRGWSFEYHSGTSIWGKNFGNFKNASPSIVTVASSPITLGGSATDTATISDGNSPTGSITFKVYGPSESAVCTGTAAFTSTVTVNGNGPYKSDSFTPTAVGNYWWVASYSGDGKNNPASTSCGDSGETLVVNKLTPTILTSLSSEEVTVGTAVTDSATLSSVTDDAGGTIVFKVFSGTDTDCSGTALFTSGTIAVSGPDTYGPSTPNFVPDDVGAYRWQAFYSGDANNNPATSSCSAEILTVIPVTPTISTLLSAASISIGGSVYDTAILSGATSGAGGSVTYSVYSGDSCALPALDSDTVPVTDGVVPNSKLFNVFSSAGKYSFQAVYSGDSNNDDATSDCTTEILTVGKESPSIVTIVSPLTIVLGGSPDSASDTATLSGGASPTGSITFNVYGPSESAVCTVGSEVFTDTVTVDHGNGDYTSDQFTPSAAGKYWWVASYSGDGNNAPISSACGDELLTVEPPSGQPLIVTVLNPSTIVLGAGAVTDTAALSGGLDPTGTITFNVYGAADQECSLDPIATFTVNVDHGNGDYTSDPFTPPSVGTFQWIATYSGDGNDPGPISSACGDESLVVTPAAPEIVTMVSPSTITLGTLPDSASDTATLSGGVDPTGTITFNVYGPSESAVCNLGSEVFTSTVDVDHGNGQYTSDPFTPSAAGKYWWVASYSGDDNNDPASDSCGAQYEVLAVEPPSGQALIVTVLDASTITLGDSVADTAILSGGVDPTGTITFNVYGPSETAVCTGAPVFTSTVTVDHGNGDYKSASFTPSAAGKYWWVASYSGDDGNDPMSDACGNELLIVEPPSERDGEMPPVGGELYSVNKVALFSPYLALLAVLGAVGVAFTMRRHRDA